jgi:hypothetical protein
VLLQLDAAQSSVDDMDEWLGIFNVKLRHMREDIESIEARNNMLEMQAQNNGALVQEMDTLLERLRVPPEYAAILTGGTFEEARMPQNVEACDWLAGALHGLEPPFLDANYATMRAVKDKRAELEKLKATFVRRASDFLRSYFSNLVDFMISDKSYFSQVHFVPLVLNIPWHILCILKSCRHSVTVSIFCEVALSSSSLSLQISEC